MLEFNSNFSTLPVSSHADAEEKNNSESFIQKTIEELNICSGFNTFAIARELRKIAVVQYKINSQKKPEDLRVCAISGFDAIKIAKNINAYVSAAPSQPLQAQLKTAVYDAAKYSLGKNPYLDEIVDIACALDHINYTGENPKDEVFKTIIRQLDEAIYLNRNRDVGHDVWAAFALRKVKVQKNALLNKFCFNILRHVYSLTPLEISLVAKGFVQANFKKPELFFALRDEAIKKRDRFTVNEIVNTIWAYCYANWSEKKDPSITRRWNERMIQTFILKLTNEMKELNVDQVVRIAWTFKNMNVTDAGFFNAVREKIGSDMRFLTYPALVNITKLLSNIKGNDDSVLIKLLEEIEEKLARNASCFSTGDLAQITYAVLIKFCYEDENFAAYDGFIHRMLERMAAAEPSNWDDMHLWQLRTAAAIYAGKSANMDASLIFPSRLQELIESIAPLQNNSVESSQFHLDVKKHLEQLLSEHQESPKMSNEFPFEGYFSLDIAFPDHQLAIEIDGHCHFDERGNYMPKDVIKETLLQLRGWDLVRITHAEWPGGNNYESADYDQHKREFLLRKLSKFLVEIAN